MTNPHFFVNCTHGVIQVGQIWATCCKNKYTSILLTSCWNSIDCIEMALPTKTAILTKDGIINTKIFKCSFYKEHHKLVPT